MKFGDHGFFRLEATHTDYDYRYIRKLVEEPNHSITATERRCMKEGSGMDPTIVVATTLIKSQWQTWYRLRFS